MMASSYINPLRDVNDAPVGLQQAVKSGVRAVTAREPCWSILTVAAFAPCSLGGSRWHPASLRRDLQEPGGRFSSVPLWGFAAQH